MGPNSANAGPLLHKVVTTEAMHPLIDMSGSMACIRREPSIKKKKEAVNIMNSWPKVFLSTLLELLTILGIDSICGLKVRVSSLRMNRNHNKILLTFIPPAVDPEHPPITMRIRRNSLLKVGQTS